MNDEIEGPDLNRPMTLSHCSACGRHKTIQGRQARNTIALCPRCDHAAMNQVGLSVGADARKAREAGHPLPGYGWSDQDKL